MDKPDYDKRLLTMLKDNTTYQQLQKDPTPNTEKTVSKFISQLVADNNITKIWSFRLKSSNEQVPVLCGLPKLHKENIPLRPIVSFTSPPTYNLSKALARIVDRKKPPPCPKFDWLCKIYHIYYHKRWWTNGVFWCCLPIHWNTYRIGCRKRKKLVRSFERFGRNQFLVSGGYLQRPSNLLKCYPFKENTTNKFLVR